MCEYCEEINDLGKFKVGKPIISVKTPPCYMWGRLDTAVYHFIVCIAKDRLLLLNKKSDNEYEFLDDIDIKYCVKCGRKLRDKLRYVRNVRYHLGCKNCNSQYYSWYKDEPCFKCKSTNVEAVDSVCKYCREDFTEAVLRQGNRPIEIKKAGLLYLNDPWNDGKIFTVNVNKRLKKLTWYYMNVTNIKTFPTVYAEYNGGQQIEYCAMHGNKL